MRITPEALPMLRLRVVQLTLLTSLAFGVASITISAPVIAQTQQDSSTIIPNLSGYDRETRQSIELACIVKKSDGPVVYGTCLNQQIASLKGSPGNPSLSGNDGETRQAELPTSTSGETRSGTSTSRAPSLHLVDPMNRFTSENIMRVHQGMGSNKILEMFGAPKKR